MINKYYALHDDKTKKEGTKVVYSVEEAEEYNKKGYGIFWTPNDFEGKRRIDNLIKINYWYVDIDDGTKEEQLKLIDNSPLKPSIVVESKNGYHCYWKAVNADKDIWDKIVSDRLIPFFNGDPRAKDITRLLRVPNFLHLKNPKDPFKVKFVEVNDVSYMEWEMLACFRENVPKKTRKIYKEMLGIDSSSSFWSAANSLACKEGLERLSGEDCINNEEIEFRENADGTSQIICDGELTSCWIDLEDKIGSYTGVWSIPTWINYYCNDWKKVKEALLSIFKEELLKVYNGEKGGL